MIEKREKQQILTLVKFMFFLKMTNNSELSKHFPDHFLSLSKTNSIRCIQKVFRPLCFVHILLFHSLLLNWFEVHFTLIFLHLIVNKTKWILESFTNSLTKLNCNIILASAFRLFTQMESFLAVITLSGLHGCDVTGFWLRLSRLQLSHSEAWTELSRSCSNVVLTLNPQLGLKLSGLDLDCNPDHSPSLFHWHWNAVFHLTSTSICTESCFSSSGNPLDAF